MDKKTIIIIALLVVAAFIAWKKGWFAKAKTTPSPAAPNTVSDYSTDAIIENTSMTALEKEKCRGWVKEIESAIKQGRNGWSYQSIKNSAIQKGVSYNQQLVISAIWQMYATAKLFGQEYANKIISEVNQM